MSTGDIAALWEGALAHDRAGRASDAAGALASIAATLLDEGRFPPPHLIERMGRTAARAGALRPAFLVLLAARERLVRTGDALGAFTIGLQLAEVALAAGDEAGAGRILADLAYPGGARVSTSLPPREALNLLASSDWAGATAAGVEHARVRAALVLAQLWAAAGRLGDAIAAGRWALDRARARDILVLPDEIALFVAELLGDRGDVAEALAVLPDDHARAVSGGARIRAALVRSRVLGLAGRLSEARTLALAALAGARPSECALALAAAHLLGQQLVLLNRTGEALAIAHEALERARTAGADEWTERLRWLVALAEERRAAAAADAHDAFVPALAGATRGELTAAQAARASEARTIESRRVAVRFALAFNGVVEALARGELDVATRAAEDVSNLAASIDSPRLAARARFVKGLVLEQRGRRDPARERHVLELGRAWLADAADAALAGGWLPDAWQAKRAEAWAAARLGDDDGERRALEALVEVSAQIGRGLNLADAALWSSSRETAVDAWLRARASAVGRAVSPWRAPISALLRQRRIRALHHELRVVSGWQLERALTSAPAGGGEEARTPDAALTAGDVAQWVLEQVRVERGRRRVTGLRVPIDTMLLQFHALPDRLVAFRFTTFATDMLVLPTSRAALRDAASEAFERVQLEYELQRETSRLSARALATLAERVGLEELVGTAPRRIRRLVIVPHGSVCNLPFAALPLRGEPLCRSLRVSFSPAAADVRGPRRQMAGDHLSVAISIALGHEYPPLGAVRSESERVETAAGARAPVRLLDEAATPAAVLAALPTAGWAHFACHGELDLAHPHRSGLVLAGGRLTVSDIRLASLARLRCAVVGACWTGDTVSLPGQELVSVPVAFVRAGAGGALSALWEIKDTTATAFVEAFTFAARTRCLSAALACVQASWARGEGPRGTAIPFHWAGYTLFGDG